MVACAIDTVTGEVSRARFGPQYEQVLDWHAWLAAQRFDDLALQAAYDSAYETVVLAEARRARLDKAITALAADSAWTGVAARLGSLRGIDTLTAFALAVEIGDWERFTGSSIGAYLGLVPTESSSGQSRSQGPITKTGNTHARRLLVEAAWHHRKRYRPGATIQARWNRAPAAARARGHLPLDRYSLHISADSQCSRPPRAQPSQPA